MTAEYFSSELLRVIKENGTQKIVGKKELILREGEVERNLYYIESGAVRLSFLTEFEDQTIRLGYKGNIINSLSSYFSEKPSQFYIEALRKTTLIVISKEDVVALVNQNQQTLKGYIEMLEQQFVLQMEREVDLLTPSPADRLKRMLERSPSVFQEVPLKYIASCIRMTPETLSRLRNS